MTAQPHKPGEQLAIEALAAFGLTLETIPDAMSNWEGAEKLDQVMDGLCALPPTQQRSDAIRSICKTMEASGLLTDIPPTPAVLIGEAWLEEFEGRGGTCRLTYSPDSNGDNVRILLRPIMPPDADTADRAKLIELRDRLSENDLRNNVIFRLLTRGTWDDLERMIT